MANDICEGVLRPQGDLAGVFEYDGETSYFYLYEPDDPKGIGIKGHIHVTSRRPDFAAHDVAITWNRTASMVGLRIRGQLWAVLSAAGDKYGGDYKPRGAPSIPASVLATF